MTLTRKNPAAVALGKLGGSRNTPAQKAQRQAAARLATAARKRLARERRAALQELTKDLHKPTKESRG